MYKIITVALLFVALTSIASVASAAPLDSTPTRLFIARIGLDASVVLEQVDSQGYVTTPTQPNTVGWFPSKWATLLDGHSDWQGRPGVFARLHAVSVGDTMYLWSVGQWHRYLIIKRAYYDSETNLAQLSGLTPETVLLITCAGQYQPARGTYDLRLVVYAIPG